MTGAEFRPIPPDRLDDYRQITEYAFRPEEGIPGQANVDEDESDDSTEDGDESDDALGERFGVFDGPGDELRSVCKHYDFTARLRGEWVPMAGLAAVATPPEHRREGYVRRLIAGSLDRWREGYPIAALWPFSRPYYRQFGWATATTFAEVTLPTEQLGFARERLATRDDPGAWTVRRVTADDWDELRDAHDAHAAGRGLTIRRDAEWMGMRRFQTIGDTTAHAYACQRDGEIRGYVAFTFEKTGVGLDERRLTVTDMAYADHEAHLRLLALVADHDSQAAETVYYAGDASLLDLLADPNDADCEVHAGPMVRVVDVAHALETLSCPVDVSGDLTLAVGDDTAAWNDGTFRLRIENGTATCTPVDTPAAEADLTVGIGTLSQLVSGYHAVDEARRLGDLTVRDDGDADRLAALFPPQDVFLRTFF